MITKRSIFSSILIANLLLLCPCLGLCQTPILPPKYITLIQQKINANLFYPVEAKNKGWEGVTKVRFTLLPNGQIKELGIAKSSGYSLLDEAAISAVKKSSPYPSLEHYLGTEEIKIVLPINYEGNGLVQKQAKEPASTPISFPAQISSPAPMPVDRELEGFIELAIKNSEDMQISNEEIELAELKVREAQRNLFPAVKVDAYNTTGTYQRDFEERKIGLEVNQPLYYGGRLADTLKQAKINLQITKKDYDRRWVKLAYDTEVAYYSLVNRKVSLEKEEEILKEGGRILQIVQKQAAAGLATPMELSKTQSYYEQIALQINNTKLEISLAELQLMQTLNTTEPVKINQREIRIKRFDLDLNQCLESGLKNRPEVQLNKLLVKFNKYGKRIEEAKNAFTVDLSSSYSHYEGAFEGDDMTRADNWYVGFKVTKPWGGSTITTSATSEETQPRFGQTLATKSSSITGEFNLLDNLQRLSDKKNARIELKRAVKDLNDINKSITFEIKQAFLDYHQALLQVTSTQTEIESLQRETEALKAQAQVGEIGFSLLMESLVNLLGAYSTYVDTLDNYFTSMANLRKSSWLNDIAEL